MFPLQLLRLNQRQTQMWYGQYLQGISIITIVFILILLKLTSERHAFRHVLDDLGI